MLLVLMTEESTEKSCPEMKLGEAEREGTTKLGVRGSSVGSGRDTVRKFDAWLWMANALGQTVFSSTIKAGEADKQLAAHVWKVQVWESRDLRGAPASFYSVYV